jgi:hypothetical protein
MRNIIIKIMLLSVALICAANLSMAQSSLTIDASQLLTTFKFTDSEGNVDKSYLGSYEGAYSIGYRSVSDGGFLIRASLGMRGAGATMVYDDANYIWNLRYADVKAGLGYAFGYGIVRPYISVASYFGYLLKASQTLNHEIFDILDYGSLQKIDYGVIGAPGVQITISDFVSAYAEFNYLMGLKNVESSANNVESSSKGQTSKNMAYGITAGIAFTF